MTAQGFRFAGFLLDLGRHRLLGPGGEIALRPKSFESLAFILARAGRVVTKAELMEAVWPRVIVNDDSLTRCISDVRLALGDGDHAVIRTIAKIGYRVDVPVTLVDDRDAAPPAAAAPGPAGAGEQADGGRRPATTLYVDLRRALEGLSCQDPELALGWHEGVVPLVSGVLARFGASVQVAPGEGIAGFFGVPLAHEDHAVRACQAALACRASLAASARAAAVAPVGPAIGLASGSLVFRPLGGLPAPAWSAMGPTVDEARRLARAASAGTTVISAATLHLVEGRFTVESAGPPGGDALQGGFRLAGSIPRTSRFKAALARGLSHFVGRDTELAQLQRLDRLAGAGRGQVVAIVGEAGVGKSRLAHELAQSLDLQRWQVFECAAVSYGKASSYLPLIELLKSYFGIAPDDGLERVRERVLARLLALDPGLQSALPPLLALLDAAPPDASWAALDPGERRHRLLEAIVRLLLREARAQPLLLIVEDLHWVDAETQALLDALVGSLAQARVLLVLTYRPDYRHDWAGRAAYTQLRLDALAPESTGRLLDALLGTDPALERLKKILVKRGNPLFLEEAVLALVESGALAGAPASRRLVQPIDAIQIPATVQAILAARIDRLHSGVRRILEAASTIGRLVPLPLLLAITREPESQVRSALDQLQAAEFMYQAGFDPPAEYAFRHALILEVAYAGLLQARRRELHAKTFEAMETLYGDRLSEHTERLAHHARCGELGEKAVHYLRQAGLKAAARSALVDARSWFEQALAIHRTLPGTLQALQQGFEIRLELRGVLYQLGEARALLGLLGEAETLAEQLHDEHRRRRVSAFMTSIHTMLGELDAAVQLGQRSLQAARELGELELRIHAANYLVQAHYYRGDYASAMELASESLAAWPGDWAYKYHLGNPAPASVFNRAFMAMSLAQLGKFEQAARYEAEAIGLAEPTRNAFAMAVAHVSAPALHILRGDWKAARARVERYLSVARKGNIAGFVSTATAALAWVLAQAGEREEASEAMAAACRLLEQQAAKGIGNLGWSYVCLGRACLLLGRMDEALALGQRALALSATLAGFRAHALHLLGDIVGQHGRDVTAGEAFYRDALGLAEPRGMRPVAARCHAGLAGLYQLAGHGELAQEHARVAARIEGEIG